MQHPGMSYNPSSRGYKTHFGYKRESFSEQLKVVLKERKFANYNLLVTVWKKLGEKTTISVYPILKRLSKLFSSTNCFIPFAL